MGRADYINDDGLINLADFKPSPNQSKYFFLLHKVVKDRLQSGSNFITCTKAVLNCR